MPGFKSFLRGAVFAIAALMIAASVFRLGQMTALSADHSDAAGFLKTGSPTFCELSERARLLVCPAVRMRIRVSGGGWIVIYQCSHAKSDGFLEATGLSAAEKRRLLPDGMETKQCEKGDSELFRISGGDAHARPTDI
jgi:hypothetical protein